MSKDKVPFFRLQPNAYDNGIFERVSMKICPICKQETEYIYAGPFYSIEDVHEMCPWCIHNGTAATKYKGVFQAAVEYNGGLLSITYDDQNEDFMYFLDYEEIPKINDKELDELLFRTPGYVSWQESQWLSKDNELYAFIEYLDSQKLGDMREQLGDAIVQAEAKYGISLDGSAEDAGIYLFKSLRDDKYKLHVDFT
ncbi:CbrC family protein [Paenibacillus kribbensis]|uniref:CbrC family protein n=1 Tax=Paenibacillus kribbensis TaxID=172713 RepID=UPI000838F16F|nr:CbrC family protein [Paenibacillus kribbensis]